MGARLNIKNLPEAIRKQIGETAPVNKYGATTTRRYGKVFRSKLELYQYESFHQHKVGFEFQVPFYLEKSFTTPKGRKCRAIRFTIDFSVKDKDGATWYVDTKGVVTPDYVTRWNMFVRKFSENFIHIKTKKEADALSLLLSASADINEFAYDKFTPHSPKRIRRR